MAKQPAIWFGFAQDAYPSGTVTTYRMATRAYAASVFIEGRIAVDGWDAIVRRASSMFGECAVDSMGVLFRDIDGHFRALLASEENRWFKHRLASVEMLSDALLAAATVPAPGVALGKILFVGRCHDFQLADHRSARMEIEDILAPYLDRTYPQYTLGQAYPYRFTAGDEVDEDLNVEDPGLQIPHALRDQVIPIYYGPFIDTEVDPLTGLPRGKGMLAVWFMGYTHLTSGTGTVGEPTPQQAALMAAFETSAGWGGWGELVVGLGELEVPNVYGSDLGEIPRRVLLSEDRYETEVLAPGHPGWPFATNYVIRNGFRVTVIYARGPLLWQHITNTINIAVDTCGWPSAISPFNPITQAGFAYQDFINQHVFANGGQGYTVGPSAALQTFGAGDRAMFWTSKVQAWQDLTKTWLGNDVGYVISMALTEPTPLREILSTWHTSFGAFSAKDGAGQLYPFGIDDLADPTTGIEIRERIELLRLPAPRIAWDEVRNEFHWTYGWDPEQNAPRTITRVIRNTASVAAMKQVLREPTGSGSLNLRYTADETTANDVMGRRLLRLAEPPRYQDLPVRIGGVDRFIGEQVRASHRDGIGPAGVGYLNQPMVIMGQIQHGKNVTLETLDVGRIIATGLNGPIDLGGQGWGWDTWPT